MEVTHFEWGEGGERRIFELRHSSTCREPLVKIKEKQISPHQFVFFSLFGRSLCIGRAFPLLHPCRGAEPARYFLPPLH